LHLPSQTLLTQKDATSWIFQCSKGYISFLAVVTSFRFRTTRVHIDAYHSIVVVVIIYVLTEATVT
jgi:hypothetical protein